MGTERVSVHPMAAGALEDPNNDPSQGVHLQDGHSRVFLRDQRVVHDKVWHWRVPDRHLLLKAMIGSGKVKGSRVLVRKDRSSGFHQGTMPRAIFRTAFKAFASGMGSALCNKHQINLTCPHHHWDFDTPRRAIAPSFVELAAARQLLVGLTDPRHRPGLHFLQSWPLDNSQTFSHIQPKAPLFRGSKAKCICCSSWEPQTWRLNASCRKIRKRASCRCPFDGYSQPLETDDMQCCVWIWAELL